MDALTIHQITRLIADSNISLRPKIKRLRRQADVETHRAKDCGAEKLLDVIESIPEFLRKINAYLSWREGTHSAMGLYVRESRRYFAVLTILPYDTLTHRGTLLNFDANLIFLEEICYKCSLALRRAWSLNADV